MSNVYYKFASELNFNHVNFDGLHISVVDLKKAILHQKRLGKATDFDLLISNAETKEEYKEEHGLIPKNTSLIIARIPINNQHKKTWEVAQAPAEATRTFAPDVNHDISKMNGSEEDKIKMMMMQSTLDYDPTNYQRVRAGQTGEVPPNYRCYKCQKPGHWIKNCPMNPPGKEYSYKQRPESKKMTGIPRSLRDNIGNEPQEPQFVEQEKREIPEELICTICKGIFRDAVMVPCCGSSFCDDCVRTALLESEDNECPDCKEKDTSPGSLIPNRFIRKSVTDFIAESSNAMIRESTKSKSQEDEQIELANELDNVSQEPGIENMLDDQFEDQPAQDEEEQQHFDSTKQHDKQSESEEEEDDDNITVTVPSAQLQGRGANFRDVRLRRIPSHGMDSQSSVRSLHDDEPEGYGGDNSSDNYSRGAEERSKRSHNNNDRYEIPTLGGDKNGNQSIYPIHSSSSSITSHSDYPPQQAPPPTQPYQNPNQSSGMMQQQMHPQSMYQQNHYQGNYYQPNQMRPMGYDQHQGNYQHPIRHHQMHGGGHQMMRPMNDNFGVRHPRPPINNLANAVSHDIQQRFGSGYIDDPLEAFNRIMREKEMRKERFRRSPQRHSPEFRRKNFVKARRSRSNGAKSISRSKSRSRSPSSRYRRKDRRHNSRERRDDRRDYRSPLRRGPNSGSSNNRKSRSRSKYKSEPSTRHDKLTKNTSDKQADKNDHGHERDERPTDYEVNHNLDEQPPPPGDETVQPPPAAVVEKIEPDQSQAKARDNEPESSNENSVDEKKPGKVEKSSKSESSHHHKKSRRHSTPEDNEKREKKKRKKSKEHEKKKSKKDKREKKHSKSNSPAKELKSDKSADESHVEATAASSTHEEQIVAPDSTLDKTVNDDALEQSSETHELESSNLIKRSDSILDLNIDEKMDEFFPQESKWDREDDKSMDKNESFELKTSTVEEKNNITTEIIKRAENAIFAKAIRAIRTDDAKKKEESSDDGRSSEAAAKKLRKSPVRASIKSRLGVKVDESPRSRSKTPVRRKQPISSCVKVSSQDSRTRASRRSRSPRRSKSRDHRTVVTQRAENTRRNSPRRRSRSRDVKARRRSLSRGRESRDDRNRKQHEVAAPIRQRKHSPEPSKKHDEVKPVKSTRERESSRSKADDKKVSSTSANDEEGKKERTRANEDAAVSTSKRTRDSSSSSSSTSNTDEGRQKSKKKKSRSPSETEHGSSKRKKSKKEKKAKKKKKSKK